MHSQKPHAYLGTVSKEHLEAHMVFQRESSLASLLSKRFVLDMLLRLVASRYMNILNHSSSGSEILAVGVHLVHVWIVVVAPTM